MQYRRLLIQIAAALAMAIPASAQDLPPVFTPVPAGTAPAAPVGPPTLPNTGKPILVPFQCTEEDMRGAGLTCTDEDPCPVYLELSSFDSTGLRLFAAGNIHTADATLYTILLGSDDNGHTWREAYDRIRASGLDAIQFIGSDNGWVGGQNLVPLPQDPFLLRTTDGGKTWNPKAVFEEQRFGTLQQFQFQDKTSGSLLIDHGAGAGRDRYALYESQDGGDSWTIRQTSVKALTLKRPTPAPAPEWRARADGQSRSYLLEHRQGSRWTVVASFNIHLGVCRPQ